MRAARCAARDAQCACAAATPRDVLPIMMPAAPLRRGCYVTRYASAAQRGYYADARDFSARHELFRVKARRARRAARRR